MHISPFIINTSFNSLWKPLAPRASHSLICSPIGPEAIVPPQHLPAKTSFHASYLLLFIRALITTTGLRVEWHCQACSEGEGPGNCYPMHPHFWGSYIIPYTCKSASLPGWIIEQCNQHQKWVRSQKWAWPSKFYCNCPTWLAMAQIMACKSQLFSWSTYCGSACFDRMRYWLVELTLWCPMQGFFYKGSASKLGSL